MQSIIELRRRKRISRIITLYLVVGIKPNVGLVRDITLIDWNLDGNITSNKRQYQCDTHSVDKMPNTPKVIIMTYNRFRLDIKSHPKKSPPVNNVLSYLGLTFVSLLT